MELKKLSGRVGVIRLGFIIVVAVFFSRCKTGNDKTPPEIELNTASFHSEDSIILLNPEPITLEYSFKDNEELNQSRFYLSKTSSITSLCVLEDDYSVLSITEHTGKEDELSIEINLPDTIKGTYLIEFDVFDDSGNVKESSIVLEIENSKLPVINQVTSASISGCTVLVDSLFTGIPLDLNFSCEDGLELTEFFWLENDLELGYQFFTTGNQTTVEGSVFVNVPSSVTDNTILRMKITSSLGNVTWSEFAVTPQ